LGPALVAVVDSAILGQGGKSYVARSYGLGARRFVKYTDAERRGTEGRLLSTAVISKAHDRVRADWWSDRSTADYRELLGCGGAN